ncbi:hypothetical protein B0H14DRAFT_3873290 [Mycena olivaceomarginata]|nr:hypothetical protein B0H14DRAFT_3873290 [Mycena olivaceomarginata]
MLPRIRAPYHATSSTACVLTIATSVPSTSCAATGHSPVPFVISLSIGNADVLGPGMAWCGTAWRRHPHALAGPRWNASAGSSRRWVASLHGSAHFL